MYFIPQIKEKCYLFKNWFHLEKKFWKRKIFRKKKEFLITHYYLSTIYKSQYYNMKYFIFLSL